MCRIFLQGREKYLQSRLILQTGSEHYFCCEQKKENIEKEKEELETLREQYSAYDLFQRCMHSNGIAFDIIKKRLPIVNREISKILTNIVDFEIFFEDILYG